MFPISWHPLHTRAALQLPLELPAGQVFDIARSPDLFGKQTKLAQVDAVFGILWACQAALASPAQRFLLHTTSFRRASRYLRSNRAYEWSENAVFFARSAGLPPITGEQVWALIEENHGIHPNLVWVLPPGADIAAGRRVSWVSDGQTLYAPTTAAGRPEHPLALWLENAQDTRRRIQNSTRMVPPRPKNPA